ncbi:MAG: hypothetical protein HXY25_06940 [Alphaproteobacteria bacterium]|nr:hypothetical protein [Alphaproteobacteria bacterium]
MEPTTLFAVGSSVFRAVSIYQSGQAQAAEYRGRQREFERQAQQARTAASQSEAVNRDRLVADLGIIRSLRAARGVAPDSPTGQAIESDIIASGERALLIERANYLSQADAARRSGAAAGMAARNVRRSALFSSASSLFDAAATAARQPK